MHVLRGTEEYTVAEGHEWFWPGFADGSWEPETFKIFDRFLDKEKNFLDIGAWIGPTALYAAPKAKKVFAFEPDAIAFRSLVQNLDLNKADNVIPYPVAVSNEWKGIPFGAKTGYGDSMSSQIWAKGDNMVAAVDFRALILDIQPNFIKIDVEGGEKFIFHGTATALENTQPTIHLSLHTPSFTDDVEGYALPIEEGLSMYPYIYDQNLQPIELKDAFDVHAFNSVVASFIKL